MHFQSLMDHQKNIYLQNAVMDNQDSLTIIMMQHADKMEFRENKLRRFNAQ